METSVKRLHIGNISPKLVENIPSFETRLQRFGKLHSSLEVHTKPVNDFHFAFINIELDDKSYDQLKKAFNGVLYMGRKLTVSLAKPDYTAAWKSDVKRPDSKKNDRIKRDNIAKSRELRIKEASTVYPINSFNDNLVPNNTSLGSGYSLSSHVFNDVAGNTKTKAVQHDLMGSKSYGSFTNPLGPYNQKFSHLSGRGEVIKGRHRNNSRPHIYFLKKQQTIRININGELKQLKFYKTKLWGLEKNKTSNDLTWKYSNGVWKSGDDHIIERIAPKADKCGISGADAVRYGRTDNDLPAEENREEEENLSHEQSKNTNILASLFHSYDFDKPVEIEEDIGIDASDITYDSKGRRTVTRFDYEIQGAVDKEENGVGSEDSFDYEGIKSYTQSVERPQEEVYYDELDEGNEIDLDDLGRQYTTEAISNRYDKEHEEVVKEIIDKENEKVRKEVVDFDENDNMEVETEDSEEEFVPTFGKTESLVNDTETLRSLFNPNQTSESGFKLALDEDDIEETTNIPTQQQQQEFLNQIQLKQQEEQEQILPSASTTKFGLFWAHFDSPFLQTQSQLNKIGNVDELPHLPGEEDCINVHGINKMISNHEETPYEQWFWGKRGELMRECKRRKRDVNRIFKKKNTKAIL